MRNTTKHNQLDKLQSEIRDLLNIGDTLSMAKIKELRKSTDKLIGEIYEYTN
jgi:hypothetical protein